MKLRRLSLQGFKSFADRTELRFHDGITAIVGPNGCGKSNISDAIRWVLGEQRASAIRGAKMEEAIFQGTTARRAVNRAEVSLGFDNEEGRLPLPHREVEIRRVVFREGGSDYQLNRASVRLRDIFDVCRDTGLGANAYAVIEQGMVDAILSDRTEDRRHMFEEAAGIGRFKDRRKGAQRRLESAEADLARLEDVIAEVDAKVKNLARQRKRAEKYGELRARRLSLEVAVARADVTRVSELLEEATRLLVTVGLDEPGGRAALTRAETELARLRLEATELLRTRNLEAQKLEDVARRIAERERVMAVADERRVHAERRIQQIEAERNEQVGRVAAFEEELDTLESERHGQHGVVESLARRMEETQERQAALRRAVVEIRKTDEDARGRENELTRHLARLEAEAVGSDARVRDAASRLEQLAVEEHELDAELSRLGEQRDLFAEQARDLRERKEELEVLRAEAQTMVEDLRTEEDEARRALSAAEDVVSRLQARMAALEALEREHHGFAPAVAAALDQRGRLGGLLGPVAEFLRLPAARAAALEGTLSSLLQALVVRDAQAVDEVEQWLQEQSVGGAASFTGPLALLPRAALPRLEALIESIRIIGEVPREPILLGRRERVEQLHHEIEQALFVREECGIQREDAAERVAEAEAALRDVQTSLEAVELELRRAYADESNRAGHQGRTTRARQELERRRIELNAARERALGEARTARQQRSEQEQVLGSHRGAWAHSTQMLTEREAAWETVRDEEAELRVGHARAEGTLSALERRSAGITSDLREARERIAALATEEADHRESLGQYEQARQTAGAELHELFNQRDALSAGVRRLDESLAASGETTGNLEGEVRQLRRSVDERSERRHRLELQKAEAEAHLRNTRDRLEAEWARPFDQLVREAMPVDGDPDLLRTELQQVAADIERLGPINMLAVEEYNEESQRLTFLQTQRDDLVKARDDLQNAIREINKTARDLFTETFEAVRANFQHTFQALFEGGECDIRLEDTDDPLESPIEITASPRGKRTQRIHLLSGGERALTALALLFAIYLVKPSPFCVLDEVDAPLDEANIARFISMLQQFKISTQFIVITHNPRTMEAADWLYGVTMEEPGISSIVAVRIDEVLAGAGA
ncbi:MAG: AAA family ATPase [Longimicrobiales bacterium]